jgi:hypothetical protein
MSTTVTVSHSYSANVDITAGAVSAGVGFNVSWSTTTGTSYSLTMPPGTTWIIYAGYRKLVYQYDITVTGWPISSGGSCPGYGTLVGTGYAHKYINLVYGAYQK